MFVFDTETFMGEVKKLQPKIFETFSSDIKKAYETVEEISIDYGIMELTDKAVVVPISCFWSDLGNFDSLFEILDKDEMNNAVKAKECVRVDSGNNLVIAERLTVLIGVDDLIVVDTDDSLLITKKGEESQRIKEVFKLLKDRGIKGQSFTE